MTTSRPHLRAELAARVLEVRETHISWVFLTEADAFKVKKPVSMGFLDFTTLERRQEACAAEVTLNRRLAPDVYLGVVPVTRGEDGRLDFGGVGELVDVAVHMRRLPDGRRADVLLDKGALSDAALARVAERIARFHDECATNGTIAAYGRPESVARNVRENFQQTRSTVTTHLNEDEAQEIERWQLGFLTDNADLFTDRVTTGRVKDGHGDLRLEHVYLDEGLAGPEGVSVLDCIEFNERFRYADVAADVAFLSMDLAAHGRVDLAERFLALYAREANDYDLFPLVDFYESYRAYVRAKVSSFLAADDGAPGFVKERAAHEARRFYLLALAAERRPLLPPSVVAIGGPPASGKSTLAERVGAAMGAPIVDSDRTRKHLLGKAPFESARAGAWQGAYDPGFTDRVYREVLRRADRVLASGRPVLLDASFRSEDMRRSARELARAHGVAFRFVECRASPAVCRARLEERARGRSISDAGPEIFDAFLARYEPPDELPAAERVIVDTSNGIEAAVAEARVRLPLWPEGLTG